MAFLTAQRIVSAGLGLLTRESTLAATVWRDPVGDFAGALDDTISVRLPAYAPARTRVLRSGSARTKDTLNERKIDLTLDTDVYKDVGITDEQMNLDIVDFGMQVLAPITAGIVEEINSQLATAMSDATYANSIVFDYSSGAAWPDIILAAREYLNKAHVPPSNRYLAVGASIETALLSTDLFVKANESGDGGTALAEATIGRKGGFTIITAPELAPDEAIAYHKTAFAMSNKAPAVPAGAAYGVMKSAGGFAMRVVRGFDLDTVEDRTIFDSWLGVAAVTDEGYFDANGVWTPSDADLGTPVTLLTSAASDDIIDATAHGFVAGDEVVFTALTGGTGLTVGQRYFVIATSLATNTFRVSATAGGAGIDFSTDITAGTVRQDGGVQMVRAVKITAVA
jgi:hypothetical protein